MLFLALTLGASLLAADTQPSSTLHIPYEPDQTDVYAIPYDSSEEEEDVLEKDYENMYKQKHQAKPAQ